MLPTQKPKSKSNVSKQNAISNASKTTYSVPTILRWIFAILLLLLVFSTFGLLVLQSFTKSLKTNLPLKNNYYDFIQEKNILTWKTINYGKPGNKGTLEIRNIDSVKGKWDGDQINETQNNIKTKMIGTFNSSTISFIHPSGVELWIGICKNRKIEGSIRTTYDSQLKFEMRQSD